MVLGIIFILLAGSGYIFFSQFSSNLQTQLTLRQINKNNLEGDLSREKKTKRQAGAWLPLTTRFKEWERRVPFSLNNLRRRLITAGEPMGTLEFLFLKILAMALASGGAFILLNKDFSPQLILMVSLAIGLFLPEFWLKGKIKKRQANIKRDLPNVIDLLNLCVGAGLDFMLAVHRVVKDIKPCELTRELADVYHQTRLGKSRREAMQNFAWRIDTPETYSFVRALLQADRMGSPISEAMNLQAEEMRFRRFQQGEAMALKAPIKLLFPLFVFILPVVLIIVAGPILLQFIRGGLSVSF